MGEVNLVLLVVVVAVVIALFYAYEFIYERGVAQLIVQNPRLRKGRFSGPILGWLKSFQRIPVAALAMLASNLLGADLVNPILAELNKLAPVLSQLDTNTATILTGLIIALGAMKVHEANKRSVGSNTTTTSTTTTS